MHWTFPTSICFWEGRPQLLPKSPPVDEKELRVETAREAGLIKGVISPHKIRVSTDPVSYCPNLIF